MELEIQGRSEECSELGGECGARGKEAERLQEQSDEKGDHGPQHDQEGEQGAWQGEEQLQEWVSWREGRRRTAGLRTRSCSGLSSGPFS